MRHVSRTHRVALDWLFDRIKLDTKIQITCIDTKNQLADILTKGNFTRDEWNYMLSLFNISHFSSTVCSGTMAKRLQQEPGEERCTAKSRPKMSLLARVPSNVSSSTSTKARGREVMEIKIPGVQLQRKRKERGDPLSAATERPHLTIIMNNLIKVFPQQVTQKWDDNHAWSSQEWKTDTEMCERPGRSDVTSWGATRESKLGFSHEETHHDGTAQSVVNEVIPRERSGRPDVDPQRGA